MNEFNTQRPYIASYIIFRNPKGEVAFLKRTGDRWMSGHYSLPAGKVEHDESFIACAVREVEEEVGVNIQPQDLEYKAAVHRYTEDPQGNNWIDVFFEASNWEGELINAEPEAHSELAWFLPESLPKNTVPNVQEVLKRIRSGETYIELYWEEAK